MTEELIALIGVDAFVKLACVLGGTKLYIGLGESTEKKLTVLMGSEACKKIMQAYPSQWLYVPKYTTSLINSRNKLIALDCDAGLSLNQLAMKYELTQRQICYILKKPDLATYE